MGFLVLFLLEDCIRYFVIGVCISVKCWSHFPMHEEDGETISDALEQEPPSASRNSEGKEFRAVGRSIYSKAQV